MWGGGDWGAARPPTLAPPPPFFAYRDFAATLLPAFEAANPQLAVVTHPVPGAHPYVRGEYVNGTSKTRSVRGLDARGVAAAASALRDATGRKATVRVPGGRVRRASEGGVQGGWRPAESAGV